ncbi:MAG: hypothetical protein M3044_18210 [Thermoproteota archaeon]|nr:hypothetical protein [Thermoproteota archaeon]
MNSQRLFGPLAKSREHDFADIIGHEHIKRIFGLALRSQGANLIHLSGRTITHGSDFDTAYLGLYHQYNYYEFSI